jgi:hypothetical protein
MAIKEISAADIENAIRDLTVAEKTNLGIEVTVPVAYGDGTLVTVVIEPAPSALAVHDAGFSAMRLSGAGVSLTPNVNRRLEEFTQRYRCEFKGGRVSAFANMDDIAQVVCLVANAARAVADYVYEIRRHAETDFRLIVVDKLREIVGKRAHEADEFRGKSGRLYRIPFVLNESMTGPQNFVSTIANRPAVNISYATLSDLRGAYPHVERDAVYDDDAGIRDEDRAFLRSADALVFGWMEADVRFKGFTHNVEKLN